MGVLDDMGRMWDASKQLPRKPFGERMKDAADAAESAAELAKNGPPPPPNGVSYNPFENMAAMNAAVRGSGTVASITDTGEKIDGASVYDLTIDVIADGQPGFRATHRQLIAAAALGNWQVGKVLPVRFDPNDATHQLTIG
jgi:hypothetical protein